MDISVGILSDPLYMALILGKHTMVIWHFQISRLAFQISIPVRSPANLSACFSTASFLDKHR